MSGMLNTDNLENINDTGCCVQVHVNIERKCRAMRPASGDALEGYIPFPVLNIVAALLRVDACHLRDTCGDAFDHQSCFFPAWYKCHTFTMVKSWRLFRYPTVFRNGFPAAVQAAEKE